MTNRKPIPLYRCPLWQTCERAKNCVEAEPHPLTPICMTGCCDDAGNVAGKCVPVEVKP